MTKTSRRELFKRSALLFSGVALVPSLGMGSGLLAANDSKYLYPLPPGAVSLERFRNRCTACQLCVSRCPTHVLKPALWENGLTGFMQPILKYEVHQFCEFECKECIDVCPNDALTKITLEEKKLTQIGIVRLVLEKCIVIKDDESCGACAEHCPTKALRMVPYEGDLTKPEITNPEVCIGCGACESICPELKEAIYIERHPEHLQAEPPIVEKQEDVDIDDFGF
jgi:ferredoxin